MIAKFFTSRWSPYLSGIVVAFLFVLALYVLDSPPGMSDAYIVLSEYCQETYHNRAIKEPPFLDWQTGFLGGIFIGALIASLVGGDWRLRLLPESRSGGYLASAGASVILGFAGGFLVMLGLQLAGDSLIGQWAAAIQLSTGAWIFFLSILFWGVMFTLLLAAKFAKSTSAESKTSDK